MPHPLRLRPGAVAGRDACVDLFEYHDGYLACEGRPVRDLAAQIAGGARCIFGVMVESHLVDGAQKFSPGKDDPAALESALIDAGFEAIRLRTYGNLARAWGRHLPTFALGLAGDLLTRGYPGARSTILAVARPIPLDPPVMRTLFPSIFMSLLAATEPDAVLEQSFYNTSKQQWP